MQAPAFFRIIAIFGLVASITACGNGTNSSANPTAPTGPENLPNQMVNLDTQVSATPSELPVTPPVTEPVTPPVTEPVTPPVTKPVTPPVTNPVTPPVTTPITPPVTDPVTPPVTTPVTPPVTTPVTPPVTTPVTPPVTRPITPPVTNPVTPPVTRPITPPVTRPIATPTPARETPSSKVDYSLATHAQALGEMSIQDYDAFQYKWVGSDYPACNFFLITALCESGYCKTQKPFYIAAKFDEYFIAQGWETVTVSELKQLFLQHEVFDSAMQKPGPTVNKPGHVIIPIGYDEKKDEIIVAEGSLGTITNEIKSVDDSYIEHWEGGFRIFVNRKKN